MKKIRFILIGILFILLELTTTSVYGWCGNKHEELANMNASYGKLTPSQVRLTNYCATLADKKNYRGGSLHGTKNYVKSMELLYTCAYNLKNDIKDPISSALDKNYKDPAYLELYKKINLLLSEKVLPGEEERSNTAKAAKVLGFACHLAGDIYAHRTIVPVDANKEVFEDNWNRWKTKTESLNKSKNGKPLPTLSMLFGNSLEEGGKGRLKILEGQANFLSIKKWCTDNKNKKKYVRYIALAFEDNPDFYKERYQIGAMELTKNLFTLYGENRCFDEKAIFQTSCSIPLQPATP